jgi:acetyltransferase-like isoleucine patch superfamily enzyme
MSVRSLNSLRKVRAFAMSIQRARLRRRGVEVHPSSTVSLSGRTVTGMKRGIVIDAETLVAFKTLLITRDPVSGEDRPIHIGKRCFIGGGSTILPA